jgi:hypothetical protein
MKFFFDAMTIGLGAIGLYLGIIALISLVWR